MREAVTVGHKTFIKDDRVGWVDRNTREPADEALVQLLESASNEISEPFRRIRSKIDKSVDPITIGKMTYVFDINDGWVDKKTKIPVPHSIQKKLNAALKQSAISNLSNPNVSKQFGMSGAAINDRVKKQPEKTKDGAGSLQPVLSNTTAIGSMNSMLGTMITHMFAINDYLNQKLKNAKIIADGTRIGRRENLIERLKSRFGSNDEKLGGEIADSSSVSPMLVAGLMGAVFASFEPISDLVTKTYDGIKGVIHAFGSVMSTVNSALIGFLDVTGGDPVKEKQESGTSDNPSMVPSGTPREAEENTTGSVPRQMHENPSQGIVSPSKGSSNVSGGGNPSRVDTQPVTPSTGGYAKPIDNMVLSKRGYGMRMHPIKKRMIMHKGQDMAAAKGTAVKSVADGRIIRADGKDSGGYGNQIVVQHSDGTQSQYAHLNDMGVRVGDTVRKGQRIGSVGSTGGSTGPHLHFEMRKNGKAVDPTPYLTGASVVAGSTPMGAITEKATETVKAMEAPVNDYAEKLKMLMGKMKDDYLKYGIFDTTYKSFNKLEPVAADSVKTHKAKVNRNTETLMVIDRPNIAEGGASVKTPSITDDAASIKQYLKYFDLI